MRAAWYDKNGPAGDVLNVGEVKTPTPGPGEVRIKLETSGINPSDVRTRAGTTRKLAYPRVIPHSDGAGKIDMVGDGVPKTRVGERVWTWNAQWRRPFGTAAEYVVLPSSQAVNLPANTSAAEGACLGIPAITASHAVELAGARKGVTLFIAGGAGAVSQYAIQFAKARGAFVIATVSSDNKAKIARGLGVDHIIDYKHENVGERVMDITAKRGVDSVIEVDLAANANIIPSVLRPKGSIIVYGTAPQATIPSLLYLFNSFLLQFMLVYELGSAERERALSEVTRMLEAGQLTSNLAETFELADIGKAHEAVEQGAIGNVVLQIR